MSDAGPYIVLGIMALALLGWMAWHAAHIADPPSEPEPPQWDAREDYHHMISAMERMQSAALETIARENQAGRDHVESIVTQFVNPPTPTLGPIDTSAFDELQGDDGGEDGLVREASDEWFPDGAFDDPYAPPPGAPLPPPVNAVGQAVGQDGPLGTIRPPSGGY